MKQLSFNHHSLMKNIKQIQLLILLSVLFGTKICGQQIVNNGGTITMSGAAYMVVNNASFINNGTFTPSTSTVSFTGTSAYSVGTNATTPTLYTNFYNLTNTNSTTGTVNPLVTVANTLSVTAGTLSAAGNLTLLSTASSTANVSAVGGAITGNVNVQRYIPAKRAWRLMTAPVSNTSSIFSTWQNSNVFVANKGIFITGTGAISTGPTSSNDGLDYSSRNTVSMKTWDYPTQLYTNVLNTNTWNLSGSSTSAANIGYFVFIRGDRTPANLTLGSTSLTTLTSTGLLQTGAQTFTASSTLDKFTLIGNPYASPVDFKKIAVGGLTNVSYTFYTWDASIAGVGGFVTFTSTDNGVTYTNSTSSGGQTTVIQSGQAFFVKTLANNPASVTFQESNKSAAVLPTAGFKPMAPNAALNIDGSVRADLYYVNADSTLVFADGNLTQFGTLYSDKILINEDADKLTNVNENLGLMRHNTILAIESRPNLSVIDTMFFNMSKTTQRAYRFQFMPTNLDNANLVGYLQDKYLNTSAEISLTHNTPIDFTINGDAASSAADRFQIVFKTVLPFAFTNIAAAKNNSDIAVEWKVANETDIVQYDVEKSTDGTSFTKTNTNLVKGNNNAANNYIWLDANAQIGNNIYRVKMTGKDGSTKYTETVKVNIADINTGITIYPNPIKEGKINIQMGNQPTGNYQLSITNNNGQVIYTGTVQNNSRKSNFLINLNSKTAKGIYNLQIVTPDNKISSQKLIVE